MHLRSVISTVLTIALLPLSSFAGACGVHCRTSILSKARLDVSADGARSALHHAASHEMVMESGHRMSGPASSTEHSQGHRCCNENGTILSAPCSPANSALQEKIVASKSGQELATAQTLIIALSESCLYRHAPTKLLSSPGKSLPLPLRI